MDYIENLKENLLDYESFISINTGKIDKTTHDHDHMMFVDVYGNTLQLIPLMQKYDYPPFIDYFYEYNDEGILVFKSNNNISIEGYEEWLQNNGYDMLDIYKPGRGGGL